MTEAIDWVADCEEWDPEFRELNRATEPKPFNVMEELAAYRGRMVLDLWREKHWTALETRKRRKHGGRGPCLETVAEETPPLGRERPRRRPRKRRRRGKRRTRKTPGAGAVALPGPEACWRLGRMVLRLYAPILKLYLAGGIRLACSGAGTRPSGERAPLPLPPPPSPPKILRPAKTRVGRALAPPRKFASLPVLRNPPSRGSRRVLRRPRTDKRIVVNEEIKKSNKNKILKGLKDAFRKLICWKKEN